MIMIRVYIWKNLNIPNYIFISSSCDNQIKDMSSVVVGLQHVNRRASRSTSGERKAVGRREIRQYQTKRKKIKEEKK